MKKPVLTSEPFFSVDAAWLNMDSPTNTVAIAGLLLFEEKVDFASFRDQLGLRLMRFPRFRQRVKTPELPFNLPIWDPDPEYCPQAHIHSINLPGKTEWRELLEFIEQLMRIPLDPEKPLWQMYLIENYSTGSALVVRLSHAMADGVALMEVMNHITDAEAEQGEVKPFDDPIRFQQTNLLEQAFNAIGGMLRLSEILVREGVAKLASPSKIIRTVGMGLGAARSLAKLLLIPPDHKTSLKGKCGTEKRAAASPPLLLSEIKLIGKALGGTVNDVILSAVSGGIRRYLNTRGESVNGVNIRAFVPVYLNQGNAIPRSGNGFGLTFLSLPIGVRDPVRRLRELRKRMQAIKNSPEAMVAYGIMFAMGYLPVRVDQMISTVFGLKATAVMTNVPGPREPRYMNGRRVSKLMFWVPQLAGLAMGISLISYAGEIIVGLATDACVVENPEEIMEGFQLEIEELRDRAQLALEEKLPTAAGYLSESAPCLQLEEQKEQKLANRESKKPDLNE